MRTPALVVDTHADTTGRLLREDSTSPPGARTGISTRARAREGGLDAVRETIARHPESLALVTTAAGIRRARAADRLAVLMGVEGGHTIDDDLGVLRLFSALGVQ